MSTRDDYALARYTMRGYYRPRPWDRILWPLVTGPEWLFLALLATLMIVIPLGTGFLAYWLLSAPIDVIVGATAGVGCGACTVASRNASRRWKAWLDWQLEGLDAFPHGPMEIQ